jgi:hypothetical protein
VLILIYSQDGNTYSDFELKKKAQEIVDTFHNHPLRKLSIANYEFIDTVRWLFAKNNLPHDKFVVVFKGKEIKLNHLYEYDTCVDGFGDFEQKRLHELYKIRKNICK